ncbi:hypothetical protein BAY59_25805 [Prauserella coralliicola]|nr:hypothetical protein BAY59_25805 [Prauserella coralliicola]
MGEQRPLACDPHHCSAIESADRPPLCRPSSHLADRTRPSPVATTARGIADLVRASLGLDPRASATVRQLARAEPGRPPIEAKIMVLGAESGRWTIHAAVSEVDD